DGFTLAAHRGPFPRHLLLSMKEPSMIRRATILALVALTGSTSVICACRKSGTSPATQSLQQSFNAAEPETHQGVTNAIAHLQAGNYPEAARALEPVAVRTNLTASQKQAIGLALQQINQAIAQNPSLDTKE